MTESRVALVTGANKGIGYEIARGLGAAGDTVLIGSRDVARGEAAAAALTAEGMAAVAVELDVTDPVSISAAAALVERQFARLDVLVNNAGVLLERGQAPSGMPVQVLERTFATNVLAVVAVTNALLPLLRRAPAARIVNLSSELGSLSYITDRDNPASRFPLLAYSASKSALNAVTACYANELRDTAVLVNACTPGYCATDLNGRAGHRTAAQGAVAPLRLASLPDGGPTGTFTDEAGAFPW